MEAASLTLLIEMAQAARDEAARAHGRRVQATEQARKQQATLADYARDYQQRSHHRASAGMDPAAAANQRAFLVRLEQALQAQVHELAARQAEQVRSAANLCEFAQRHERLLLLQTRSRQAALERDNRRDQKLMDEFAQRARPALASPTSSDGQSQGEAATRTVQRHTQPVHTQQVHTQPVHTLPARTLPTRTLPAQTAPSPHGGSVARTLP